ncbi:type I-E CRISPR-associated protein Cas6/Cse3/CasE [Actinobacteria bacterium YIM 96077]|uniref:Type I-E CRISPR-associated protein Cas6/Cse3/CasE n=1 Tax=Phytoactinopolyspora halophila TaxID=1981511 RepID=A0A329QHU8_9ACTN|nr:type I-E CRISPR-associated protein Cas6/Cse3/CasE [Phytoactinopolyspora halophila]AYY12435.1 type I-E CRISPR-associated protein Cas6/Cse3/CasE [Actinobacteria bacterium YIM 96077]RAW11987.1 type I-E CRISPR-associated protein Cas6/Cse3/CasE [Phytoactinopolyspora halophila]
MFLTRMPINPARRGARRLMASPQALHAAVLAGFAEPPAAEDGRVLWRLDSYGKHRVLLYVASPNKPDFTHIVEQAGWPTTQAWETRPYDDLLDSLQVGKQWHFRLTANPVHSGRREDWTDTKPLPHVTVKQQEKWLLDRASRLGFRVLPTRFGPADGAAGAEPDVAEAEPDVAVVDRSIRRFKRRGTQVTVAMATFQGKLEITDVDAMRHTLTHGVGRAKAYGCGLLTLARLTVNAAEESDVAVSSA